MYFSLFIHRCPHLLPSPPRPSHLSLSHSSLLTLYPHFSPSSPFSLPSTLLSSTLLPFAFSTPLYCHSHLPLLSFSLLSSFTRPSPSLSSFYPPHFTSLLSPSPSTLSSPHHTDMTHSHQRKVWSPGELIDQKGRQGPCISPIP